MARFRRRTGILLLDGNNDGLSVVVARCLQRAGGYRIHCLSREKHHDLRFSLRSRIRHAVLDTPEEMLFAIRRYAARHTIDMVIPIHVDLIQTALRIADELQSFTRLAPLPGIELFGNMNNKWAFHELMTAAGIRVPRTVRTSASDAAWREAVTGWGCPLLLKPAVGRGGGGIRRFDHAKELFEALDRETADGPDSLLVQEYIPGIDMGCSFVARNGRIAAHTIQKTLVAQCRPYSSGLAIEFIRNDAVSGILARFAEVTGWSGVGNMDLRLDERTGEIHLLEVNPRYWQTLLGSLAMGINFPDLHCRIARGMDPDPPPGRTGDWINIHTVAYDLVNIKALKQDYARAFYVIGIREFFADPLLEAFFIWDGLRRFVRCKLAVRKQRRSRYGNRSRALTG